MRMAPQNPTFLCSFKFSIILFSSSSPLQASCYFSNSETHPTSGVASALSNMLSLFSLSNILALRALPDSTLSTGPSSSDQTADAAVGVDGRLQKPALNPARAPLGDANPPFPICNPHELGTDCALQSCNRLSDATISFTDDDGCHDSRRRFEPLGDIGGDAVVGVLGGEISVAVVEQTKFFDR